MATIVFVGEDVVKYEGEDAPQTVEEPVFEDKEVEEVQDSEKLVLDYTHHCNFCSNSTEHLDSNDVSYTQVTVNTGDIPEWGHDATILASICEDCVADWMGLEYEEFDQLSATGLIQLAMAAVNFNANGQYDLVLEKCSSSMECNQGLSLEYFLEGMTPGSLVLPARIDTVIDFS